MSDNVVKFRRIEKNPEKPPKKDFKAPSWLAWVVLVLVACAIVALQQSGVLGR
ncbi:MAG: hypothetical protein JWP26_956 [Devosia sp.]|uniref:hypothetical protein n=1 Tax=Devosia sp. TaxID=1871048 RepID=UPI00260D6A29|nr:hypothetical protein [Devosia sp.]MDB5585986.1 hypothetical protein [Devosia sp.]